MTSVTDHSVGLSWTNPPGAVVNDTVRVGAKCGPWLSAISVGVVSATIVPELAGGSTYCFGLSSWTAAGEGPLAFVLGRTSDNPPGPPTDLRVGRATANSVSLLWSNPPGAILSDTLYVGRTCGAWTSTPKVVPSGGATVSNLSSGTSYCFAVTASTNGGSGPPSADLVASTAAAVRLHPPVPLGPTLSGVGAVGAGGALGLASPRFPRAGALALGAAFAAGLWLMA